MKGAIAAVCVVLFVAALGFGTQLLGLWNYQFFAPKYEAAKNEVFHNTPQYTEGKERDLDRLQLQYVQAKSSDEKAVIRANILHEFAVYEGPLTPDHRLFLNQIRSGY